MSIPVEAFKGICYIWDALFPDETYKRWLLLQKCQNNKWSSRRGCDGRGGPSLDLLFWLIFVKTLEYGLLKRREPFNLKQFQVWFQILLIPDFNFMVFGE